MFYSVSDDTLSDDTVVGISVEYLNIVHVLSLMLEV